MLGEKFDEALALASELHRKQGRKRTPISYKRIGTGGNTVTYQSLCAERKVMVLPPAPFSSRLSLYREAGVFHQHRVAVADAEVLVEDDVAGDDHGVADSGLGRARDGQVVAGLGSTA